MNNSKISQPNQIILILLIWFSVFVLIIEMIIEDNIAIIATGLLYILIGLLFVILIANEEKKKSIYLFILFFCIYFLYMSFVHYGVGYMYDKYNIALDEITFYTKSNMAINYLKSGYSFFDIANIYEYHKMPAYIYISSYLAIFTNEIGANSILVQKLLIVFFLSLVPVVLYQILRIYMDDKFAVLGAIFYGLFTHTMPLSAMILRDAPVALTYLLVFFILLQKLSIKNIVLLISTLFFSIYLRFETGMFLLGFTSIYVLYFIHITVKNKFIIFGIYTIIFSIFIIVFLQTSLSGHLLKILSSNEAARVADASSSSLGMKLRSLPYGLGILGITIFGQLQPFPPWLNFESDSIFSITESIAGISWFFVDIFVFYGIYKMNVLQYFDIKIKYMFYFSLFFIIIVSSIEPVGRRLMAVYPIFFLIALYTFINIDSTKRKKIIKMVSLTYIWLLFIFLVIKLRIYL